jgi:uncharacterized membrane protein
MPASDTGVVERSGGGAVNVGPAERWASVLGGGILAGAALRKRGVGGALLGAVGAGLLLRGVTGHCPVYGALGMDTAHGRDGKGECETGRALDEVEGVRLEAVVKVNRDAADLYSFWRDFTHAPLFMERIRSVTPLGETRSRWVMDGPMGRSWEWESEVTGEREGEYIAWSSVEGSDLPNRGAVWFTPTAGGTQTEVRLVMEFDPPLGVIGQAMASAFHGFPQSMMQEDLRRFRQLAETGEIPALRGQIPGGTHA